MIKDNEGRRIKWDDEDNEIYNTIKTISGPLKGYDLLNYFILALIYGLKSNSSNKLNSNVTGRVRSATIDNSHLRCLMMAIATSEKDSIDILAKENDYFKICEEYAKSGLFFLNEDYKDKRDEIIDDLESEMIEFYEDTIKPNESNGDY